MSIQTFQDPTIIFSLFMAVDALLLLSVLVSLLVYVYIKHQMRSLIPFCEELFHCLLSWIVCLPGAVWVLTYNGTLIHVLTSIQTPSFHLLMNSGCSAGFSFTGYLVSSTFHAPASVVNPPSPSVAPGDPQCQPPDPEFLHCSLL